MSKLIDLTGHRFGMLTVLERAGSTKDKHPTWLCRCDCGKLTIKDGDKLRGNKVRSCGCQQGPVKHGLSKHPIYKIWKLMKKRCYNKNDKFWDKYGGRGITVCDEWHDFINFYNWSIGPGCWKQGLSIDRIDNDGDYCPENCRWATARQQTNNYSQNINYGGFCLTAWCNILDLDFDHVYGQLRHHKIPIPQALGLPLDGTIPPHIKEKAEAYRKAYL